MQDVGSRLDKFLVTNIPEFSRSKIQKHIKNGKVMVNGLLKKTGYKLEINDEINILNSFMTSKNEDCLIPENIKLDIIYEDLDIIIINKPAKQTFNGRFGLPFAAKGANIPVFFTPNFSIRAPGYITGISVVGIPAFIRAVFTAVDAATIW